MPLYPTLEDMKVDEVVTAQGAYVQHSVSSTVGSSHPPPAYSAGGRPQTEPIMMALYPDLSTYMGLNLATLPYSTTAVATTQPSTTTGTLVVSAPVSQSNIVGMKRAEIQPGMRKVVLCKDAQGKLGLTVRDISKGLFVACVYAHTPAALAGLRFGDQILEVNGTTMAGFTADKASQLLKSAKPERIEMVVRDRPFERTVTLNKDSAGYVGFCFTNGQITSLVKDSSAARNGLLTDHHLVEVDGQNVVAMTDKEIARIVDKSPRTVTVTIMPSVLFQHMVNSIGQSTLRRFMDRSLPDV